MMAHQTKMFRGNIKINLMQEQEKHRTFRFRTDNMVVNEKPSQPISASFPMSQLGEYSLTSYLSGLFISDTIIFHSEQVIPFLYELRFSSKYIQITQYLKVSFWFQFMTSTLSFHLLKAIVLVSWSPRAYLFQKVRTSCSGL